MNSELNNNFGNQNNEIEMLDIDPVLSQSNINDLNPVGLGMVSNLETNVIDQPITPSFESSPVNDKESEYHRPKKSNKLILTILLLIVVLGIGGFFGYKMLVPSSYELYQNIIKNVFGYGREIIFSDEETTNIKYSGNVTFNSNVEGMDVFDDYSISYLLGVDTNKNKAEISLGLNEKEENILDGYIYILNNKGYFKSEKIYNQLIDVGEAQLDFSQMPQVDQKQLENFYNVLEQAFKNVFVKGDFNTEGATIKVDGNTLKVKEHYVVLNSKNMGTITKRFVETLESNANVIDFLEEYGNYTEEEIKELFEVSKNTDYSGMEGEVRISLYTSGLFNKLCGFSIKPDDQEVLYAGFDGEKGNIKLQDGTTVMDIIKNGKDIAITISDEETIYGNAEIELISRNEFKMIINIQDMKLKINYKSTAKDNSSVQNIKFDYEMDNDKIEVNLSNKIERNVDIANIDVSKAKAAEDISQAEQEAMKNKLFEILEKTKFYPMLERYSELNDGYGYDNLYDDFDMYDDIYSDIEEGLEDVNPACSYASCDTCSGTTCICEYYDNNFELQTITCPNEYYY